MSGNSRCDLCDALSSESNEARAVDARGGFYPPTCPSPCPVCGAPPWFERVENRQPLRELAPGEFLVSRADFWRRIRLEHS